MKRSIRLFIEGGSTGQAEDRDFRRGWKKFLEGLHDLARANGYASVEVVRGKGRGNTFQRFENSRRDFPLDRCFLLVDSEGPVGLNEKVWDVVARREGDQWERPAWARESDLYLIVQFVETWLLSDPDALSKYFKRGFNPRKLPTINLEARSKADVESALEAATRNCQRGPYRHRDANQIIEIVDAGRVQTLHHGQRLFENLTKLIRGEDVAT